MKKFLILAMAVVLTLGMVGAAFAQYHDEETSTGNTFTAGTLNLGPGSIYVTAEGGYYPPNQSPVISVTPGGDGINGYALFSDIKPGDSGIIYWSLMNDGSVTGSLDVEITRSTDSDNGFSEPEDMVDGLLNTSDGTADGDLDDYMHIRLEADLDGDGTYETLMQDGTGVGELETYLPVVGTAYEKLSNQTMGPDDVVHFKFAWRLDSDIYDGNISIDDNIIQGDSFQLDFFFELLQDAD